jgi:exosortase K
LNLELETGMDRKQKLNTLAQLGAILLIAFALKYHYSIATVNELRWILEPTRLLVETVTLHTFRFEPFAGYLSDDRTFLIAASCAGVNFLIIAFLMLNAGRLLRERKLAWTHIGVSMAVAYLVTIVANTARIAVALQMQKYDLRIGSFSEEEIHRLEGIVVYFGFLVVLFFVSEKIASRTRPHPSTLFRRSLIPLAIYYAATLGVPLAGGAYRDVGFWKHSLVVFLTPLILMLPWVIFCSARSSDPSEGEWA